jgi:nucleoside-specific outer membrane channel protein Tsx
MHWDVKLVKPKSDYKIYVELENGKKGIFDMTPYLDHGIFESLKDISYFNRVGVLFGAVTWPDEQDIAPETLIEEMQSVEIEPVK